MRRIFQYLMVQNELNENINARESVSLNNIYY